MSISTGPVIPLSYIISINNHSIYCSHIYINDDWNQDQIPNWSYNKIENSEDEIIEIVNKSWSNMAVTLQNTSQNQERICAVPEQLFGAGKRLLPVFSKNKFGGQLRPTITVARRPFRPIPGNRANGVVKAADDDAGKLQSVFLKRLYLLHICIFSFFLFNESLTTI